MYLCKRKNKKIKCLIIQLKIEKKRSLINGEYQQMIIIQNFTVHIVT